MDTISSMGWLVPAWIIGAPLLAALVMLVTTPKGTHRSTGPDARSRTGTMGTSGTTGTSGGRDNPPLTR